jgi:branched-chain amino acid transport system permease protein
MKVYITLGLMLLLILAIPQLGWQYYTILMLSFFAYATVLLGLNLLFGYTGLLSFGHALFVGLGAYTTAWLTSVWGIRSMEVMLLTAMAVAVLVAAPIGALCVRYIKIYFGMLTLAFGMLFYSFLLKFYHLTGGDEGMRVLRPWLLGRDLSGMSNISFLIGPYYYYSAAVLAIATGVMWRLVTSPFGLWLKAIRENPVKADALGVSVRRYRWYAFLLSAVYAAVGGALLGPTIGQVDPGLTYWTQSGYLVFMALLGGCGSFFGPLLGALVFIYLQDALMTMVPYWRLVFGAMLAVLVLFAPEGLLGLLTSRWGRKAVRVAVS